MRIELDPKQIRGARGEGLEIVVKGFNGCPADELPAQVYVELYEGRLKVHVWDGSSEGPQTTTIEPRKEHHQR